jgi:hypothetical protein
MSGASQLATEPAGQRIDQREGPLSHDRTAEGPHAHLQQAVSGQSAVRTLLSAHGRTIARGLA